MEFREGGTDLSINRLSHAMERRALMIGDALDKAAPFERVACTKPYLAKGEDAGSWEYRWDLIVLGFGQAPPPSLHTWEVYSKQEIRT
jgi:hypothetical protein